MIARADRAALIAARRLIARWLKVEITSNAAIERRPRPGSMKDGLFYFNADTVCDAAARRSIRDHQQALAQIDVALREKAPRQRNQRGASK